MAATLTALRRDRAGRVVLEVDGRPWRTVPDDVVVRVGLVTGMPLERPVLRRLRRELQRAHALAVAGRALSRRDLSRKTLAARLDQAGVARDTARVTLASLSAAGAVDDNRFARARAAHLAERGWGDEAIRERLEHEGVESELAFEAMSVLPSERARAEAFLDRKRDPRRAGQSLIRRGFPVETIMDLVSALDADP
jgi:SOS response regulatory protein OraA/RecX